MSIFQAPFHRWPLNLFSNIVLKMHHCSSALQAASAFSIFLLEIVGVFVNEASKP